MKVWVKMAGDRPVWAPELKEPEEEYKGARKWSELSGMGKFVVSMFLLMAFLVFGMAVC